MRTAVCHMLSSVWDKISPLFWEPTLCWMINWSKAHARLQLICEQNHNTHYGARPSGQSMNSMFYCNIFIWKRYLFRAASLGLFLYYIEIYWYIKCDAEWFVQVEQMPMLAFATAVKKIQKTIFECRRLCVNQSSKRLINLTLEH